MNWTEAQLKAIDLRDKNILVAAAAGSGKTSVLVERIRKMICEEEVPIRSFLVVTFTNAAASEMKERLRTALNKELLSLENEKDGEYSKNKSKYLRRQLLDLESANISTFHSFGLSVIRRFFYKLNIEPGFRTADETEIGIMKENAMDELLEREFESFSDEFISFMDAYSGDRDNHAIRALISQAYTKLISMPHSYDWMEDKIEELNSLGETLWGTDIGDLTKKEIKKGIIQAIDSFTRASKLLSENNLDYLSDKIDEAEINILNETLSLLSDSSKNAFSDFDALRNFKSSTLTAKKQDKEIYELIKPTVKKLRDSGKASVSLIVDSYLAMDEKSTAGMMKNTVPYLRTLRELVMKYDEIYKDIKREQGVIDFDDIEHLCLEALEDDEVQAYYRNTIKHVFVDEYQDTNLMQEAIIRRISGCNNLFMVGDIKQSIYRFRLAEPSIFQEKYDSYSLGEDENSVAIDLNENHRSKEPIINYVNQVFEAIMVN